MRWLASGVCVVVAVAQLAWCGPASRGDVVAYRTLPAQDALDALPLAESSDEDALRDKRTLGLIRQYFPGVARQNPEENQLSGAESRVYESRVAPPSGFFDLQPAASNDDAQVAASNDDAVAEGLDDTDDARSKRLTSFGGGGGGSGGSGGGSGNFIFDIIRLVTGSSNTETTDEGSSQASAGGEAAVEKDDGYQAGIPGPITRLFIIANRGIANLMQDLILRLAQTSERIVNFKARLITSII